MTRSQLIIIGVVSAIIIFLALVFMGVIPGLKPDLKNAPPPAPVTQLKMWGFKNDSGAWQSVIANYKQSHPYVNIVYNAVPEENYDSNLIDNLAAGAGPDIFVLPNSWVPKYRNKISPAPSGLITLSRISDLFPKIVTDDFVSDNQVLGLPVSIDTLALAYNRSIFDAKQLTTPPATWNEVKMLVPQIREFSVGGVSKSAIALGGGGRSVLNAADILSAMFLQLNNPIIDYALGKSTIATSAGAQALNLYAGFSDPRSSSYTWDNSQNSINSFINGKTAMVLVYKRDIEDLKARNPVLNILAGAMPQFDLANPINFANYFGLTVSRQSRNQNIAWDFINFAATTSAAQRIYVNGSGFPPALRELIPVYGSDPIMKVYATQILTAKSAPLIDYPPVLEVLNNMIESTLANRSAAQTNLKTAADKITAIIQ